jgi:hypothetical protein
MYTCNRQYPSVINSLTWYQPNLPKPLLRLPPLPILVVAGSLANPSQLPLPSSRWCCPSLPPLTPTFISGRRPPPSRASAPSSPSPSTSSPTSSPNGAPCSTSRSLMWALPFGYPILLYPVQKDGPTQGLDKMDPHSLSSWTTRKEDSNTYSTRNLVNPILVDI